MIHITGFMNRFSSDGLDWKHRWFTGRAETTVWITINQRRMVNINHEACALLLPIKNSSQVNGIVMDLLVAVVLHSLHVSRSTGSPTLELTPSIPQSLSKIHQWLGQTMMYL